MSKIPELVQETGVTEVHTNVYVRVPGVPIWSLLYSLDFVIIDSRNTEFCYIYFIEAYRLNVQASYSSYMRNCL